MNRILVILAITVAVSLARTISSNSQRSSVLKQKQLAALLDQLSRERQVYQHVKRECLRMGPLGCLDGMFNQPLTMLMCIISMTMVTFRSKKTQAYNIQSWQEMRKLW